jgi:hypothetical protein
VEVDLLDDEPIMLSLDRERAELVLKALNRLDGGDLTKLGSLVEALENGLTPPDANDPHVRMKIDHKLFRQALHGFLSRRELLGRWVVWRTGKVQSDHATQADAFDQAIRTNGFDGGFLICRIEPLLGHRIPGGAYVLDEFKKYVADWEAAGMCDSPSSSGL